ncbi:MAG TPA: hypothetical protein VF796_31065, partial [Humisphaera sp.]
AGTPTVTLAGRLSAGPLVPVGDAVVVTLNGVSLTAAVGADGSFAATFASAGLPAGGYAYTVRHVPGGTNFAAAADAAATLAVRPVVTTVTAAGVNVAAVAGAPASRTVATIADAAAAGPDGYLATIDWGDGSTSSGQVVGTGASLSVVGVHTYAAAGTATVRVTIRLAGAAVPAVTTASTATVTSLSLAAGKTREPGWWASAGAQLIKGFNGSAGSTALGNWIADVMPNLFGAAAGAANLRGRTNAEVAAYYLSLWARQGESVATQVLATALNVYATTDLLGGAQGARFGFATSATGLGARSYNVGKYGAAVGMPKNATPNVYQMLRGVDLLSRNGAFYGGDRSLQKQGESLFGDLNSI